MTNVMTMTCVLELVARTELEVPTTLNPAFQPDLEREVIVKRLTAAAAQDPRIRARFAREARSLAAMRHQSIVQVYQADLHDPLPYMVMEQLDGSTVQQRLDLLLGQRQHMSIDEAARIVRHIAQALEYAHRFGVLFHDLSLDNIVLTGDGRIVLAGLGGPLPEDLLSATPADLAFAAPELLFGGTVDARSDVYRLGVLLYTLIVGRLPFEGAQSGILSQKQTASSLPALDDPRTELPCSYTLVNLMRQATARDPGRRYATASAFCEAFASALGGTAAKLQLRSRVPYEVLRGIQARRLERAVERRVIFEHDHMLAVRRQETIAVAVDRPVVELEDTDMLAARAFGEPLADTCSCDPDTPAPAIRHHTSVLASGPERLRADPTTDQPVDSLLPGHDHPGLQAALPYTLLVPLTDAHMPEGGAAVSVGVSRSSVLTANLWIAAMIMLGVLAVGAAIALG